MPRWQYQALAEPISTAENLTSDKWAPQYPSIIFRSVKFRNLEWSVEPLVAVEAIYSDKWGPQYPDFIFRVRRTINAPWSVLTFIETITIDKWLGQYPLRLDPVRLRRPLDWTVRPFEEVIFEDKWHPQYPSKVYPLRQWTRGIVEYKQEPNPLEPFVSPDTDYFRRYLNDPTSIATVGPVQSPAVGCETTFTNYLRRYLNDPASTIETCTSIDKWIGSYPVWIKKINKRNPSLENNFKCPNL